MLLSQYNNTIWLQIFKRVYAIKNCLQTFSNIEIAGQGYGFLKAMKNLFIYIFVIFCESEIFLGGISKSDTHPPKCCLGDIVFSIFN